MPCRFSGASTTTCRSIMSAMPRHGTRSPSTATSRAGTACCATKAGDACLRLPPSIAMSRVSRPRLPWSAATRSEYACSLALDVTLGFDDASAADAHQVDAAHGIHVLRSPDQPPLDLAAVATRNDALRLEVDAGRGCDLRPQRNTGFLAFVTRAVGRGLGVLDHAIVRDQLGECIRLMAEEDLVEAVQDRLGLGALRVTETAL